MVVAESSDESMRMGVPGFVKAIASLEMENGGKHEDNVCCGTLVQQADQSMLKSNMLGQLRPIQCWRRRRPLPEFPHVALWHEVSILGSTRGTSRPCVLKFLPQSASRQGSGLKGLDLCSSGICFPGRGRKKDLGGTALEAEQLGASRNGSEVRAGCGRKMTSGQDSRLSTSNDWDHGYRLELIGDLRSWGASARHVRLAKRHAVLLVQGVALDCCLDR
jgi:hypothetical protein